MASILQPLRCNMLSLRCAVLCIAAASVATTHAQSYQFDTPDVTISGQALGDTESYLPSVVSRSDGDWVGWLKFIPQQGDQIWVGRRVAGVWDFKSAIEETTATLDNPTLTIDNTGELWLSYERWDPEAERWDVLVRRHDQLHQFMDPFVVHAGRANAINHAVAAAPNGGLWFAWQQDRAGQFDVLARFMDADGVLGPVQRVSTSLKNDWSPKIVVTPSGSVCVAWDSYDGESYDVLARWNRGSGWGSTIPVATGPSHQVHPSLAVAGSDQAWCAWEEGGENWGKDYRSVAGQWNNATDEYGPIHRFRTVSLVQLTAAGQVLTTEPFPMPLSDAARNRANGRSGAELLGLFYQSPEVVVDNAGLPWIFYRHFYAPQVGVNERMQTHYEDGLAVYARRLDSTGWGSLHLLNVRQRDGMQRLSVTASGNGLFTAWTVGRADRNGKSNQRGIYLTNFIGDESAGNPPRLRPMPTLSATPQDPGPPSVKRVPRVILGDQLFFGDLHRHTDLSLCFNFFDGTLEDAYRSSIDAVGLDFLGVTDHSRDIDRGDLLSQLWWKTLKASTRHRLKGRFFTYFSYERSNSNTDHNVISLRDDMLRIWYPPLYNFWDEMDEDTFTLPHRTSNTPGAGFPGQVWNYHDDAKRPLLEIFQGARNMDTQAEAHDGLDRGYHMGFVASSDHMSTHSSYACVWAPTADREAIFRAMQERRTYGATDTIWLKFKMGEHWMGEQVTTDGPVFFDVHIRGTANIATVDIYRDGTIAERHPGNGAEFQYQYFEMLGDYDEHYFYIHITQTDGNEAWSSPIWVTRQ